MILRLAVIFGEGSTENNFLVRHIRRITLNLILLDDHGRHQVAGTAAKVDGRIRRAAWIQTGQAVAGDTIAVREIAAKQDASVGLNRHG